MNFSTSRIWNESVILRYSFDKIKKIGNLYFYDDQNILKCQHFFNFEISPNELEELKNQLNNGKILKFNYLNDSTLLEKLELWIKENGFKCKIIDEWEAPILRLSGNKNIEEYFSSSNHSQICRNYKLYCKNQKNYKFYNSSNIDPLTLWNYVLEIDYNSWKKVEKSDMKSLNREDLQYLPFLLMNKENSNLVVICDLEDKPLAYSLMFKSDNYWYAVKWGASNDGRKKYAGFYCLFYHLKYLYSLNPNLNVDFWGRRNSTYDKLRNDFIKRKHILISKKEV